MSERPNATRRTVLKQFTTALVGGTALTGTTAGAATEVDTSVTRNTTGNHGNGNWNGLKIEAVHDHETDDHGFELSTDEVAAGWTSIEFDNTTDHTHFAYLAKLPPAAIDDAGERDLLDFYVEHVTRPFQYFMDTQVDGKEPDPNDLSDRYTTEEAIFPPWFQRVLPSGGVGLTSGETRAVSTMHLDPGEYIVECYVKNEDEDFHSYHGMIDHFTVTGEGAGAPDPGPLTTVGVSLSVDGIDAPDAVRPGQHTVAVTVQNQQIYSNLIGHNVHLIHLDGDTTVNDVNGWMNWMAPGQLVSDESAPGQFVGGVQTILTPGLLEGTERETAYAHVTLRPGTYAWVSEVPSPQDKGFLQEFTVAESADGGEMPPADPGDSRNMGPAGEQPDDDLSERAANSAMSDEMKTMVDAYANHDPDG